MDHSTRFVRALLFASGAFAAHGCASMVVPTDGDAAMIADARETGTDTIGPPACAPTNTCPPGTPVAGTPCSTTRALCDYTDPGGASGSSCNCVARDDAGCGIWQCSRWVAGPLTPPEFSA